MNLHSDEMALELRATSSSNTENSKLLSLNRWLRVIDEKAFFAMGRGYHL